MAAKCGAPTRAGHPCTRYALPLTGRCGYHGGDFDPAPGDGQPRLADGSVDVRSLLARWDEEANRGAASTPGKLAPVPLSGGTNACTILGDNRNGPGAALTAPDPASPTEES